MEIKKAVITAAGRGTRMLPVTSVVQKEMLPILNRPFIDHVVTACVEAGINEIAIVVNETNTLVEKYFKNLGDTISGLTRKGMIDEAKRVKMISEQAEFVFVKQDPELPYGNAAPLYSAKEFIDTDSFIYAWGDVFYLGQKNTFKENIDMVNDETDGVLTAFHVQPEEISTKGIVKVKDGTDDQVEYVIEKPDPAEAPSNIGTSSPYVLPADILDMLDPNVLNPRTNEFTFQDGLNKLLEDGFCFRVNVTENVYVTNGDPRNFLLGNVIEGQRQGLVEG